LARKLSERNQGVNGDSASATAELAQEEDAEEDVAEEMKKASLEEEKEHDAET
jgi:hypothetical protein